MSLKNLKCQRNIIDRLIASVKSSSISHAYIFEGDNSINKLELAMNFIKAILCEGQSGDSCEVCHCCNKINHGNYEDIISIEADGNSIKDEVIEDLQTRIKKKPYAGDRNMVIIQDADNMTLRAQNRLLKTLEEPTAGTVIILLSENIENLTQTILSRCIVYRVNNYLTINYEQTLEGAISIADMLLEGKAFHNICNKLTEFTATKEVAYEFLDALETWYRDLAVIEYDQVGKIIKNVDKLVDIEKRRKLYKKAGIHHAVKCIEEARYDLNKNINIGYSLKSMILKIIA